MTGYVQERIQHMIKLIAIDMDATLLRDDKTYDVARLKQLLHNFQQQGVKVCIATGNSLQKLITYFDEELQSLVYFAGDNGNQIVQGEQLLRNLEIDMKDYRQVIEFLAQHEGFYPAVCTGYETYIAQDLPAAIGQSFRQYNPNLFTVANMIEANFAHPPVKIPIASNHSLDTNKKMMQTMNERFPTVQTVTSGDIWLDVYRKDGGKGAAVRFLQKKYNILPSETMAFGDSLNDETMMLAVKYSVAMGNADEDLAQLCRYQIGTNNEQAVIEVLEQLAIETDLSFMAQYERTAHVGRE